MARSVRALERGRSAGPFCRRRESCDSVAPGRDPDLDSRHRRPPRSRAGTDGTPAQPVPAVLAEAMPHRARPAAPSAPHPPRRLPAPPAHPGHGQAGRCAAQHQQAGALADHRPPGEPGRPLFRGTRPRRPGIAIAPARRLIGSLLGRRLGGLPAGLLGRLRQALVRPGIKAVRVTRIYPQGRHPQPVGQPKPARAPALGTVAAGDQAAVTPPGVQHLRPAGVRQQASERARRAGRSPSRRRNRPGRGAPDRWAKPAHRLRCAPPRRSGAPDSSFL
jgi:hypothetical protein